MKKQETYFTYKGFGCNKINGEWRALAYANPSFYSTNKADLKKQINQYLRGDEK